eukprot:scaffold6590_cov30-Tisochrysis_lutea.AAC.1
MGASSHGCFPVAQNASVTAGLRCAPEMSLVVKTHRATTIPQRREAESMGATKRSAHAVAHPSWTSRPVPTPSAAARASRWRRCNASSDGESSE